MADKFVMSVRQADELDHAFERNGWEAEDVKWLSQGTNLASVLTVRRGTAKIVPMPGESLLIPVGTATVGATKKPFVARVRFVVDTGKNAPVKISYLGDNFKEWLLGKTEAPFAGSILRAATLKRSSVDGPIIAELGGEGKSETTLTEIFALMKIQRDGKKGTLFTNGYANIFYVRDVKRVLRAVDARWSGDGWSLLAHSVEGPSAWRGGGQVFSRNS